MQHLQRRLLELIRGHPRGAMYPAALCALADLQEARARPRAPSHLGRSASPDAAPGSCSTALQLSGKHEYVRVSCACGVLAARDHRHLRAAEAIDGVDYKQGGSAGVHVMWHRRKGITMFFLDKLRHIFKIQCQQMKGMLACAGR